MNRHRFRPTTFDRLEDRLALSTAAHGLHAAAAPAGTRQLPGVDVAQIKAEVNQAFTTFEQSFQSSFYSLNSSPYLPNLNPDAASQAANLKLIRAAVSNELRLLTDQLGLIVAPLRGSARLEPLVQGRVSGTSPTSLARLIDSNFDSIPAIPASYANPYGGSQLLLSADMTLTESVRYSTDNIIAAFVSGGANARRGPGHPGAAALAKARGAVNQAFASFASDFQSASQPGLSTLSFTQTPYPIDGPPVYLGSAATVEPIRQATNARIGRLSTQIDAALASLPGAAGRVQPYARSEVGGLDTGSLLLSTSSFLLGVENETGGYGASGDPTAPTLTYTPAQYVAAVSGSMIEIDRSATIAILAAYDASPGLRR